jgi:hypothetical protein
MTDQVAARWPSKKGLKLSRLGLEPRTPALKGQCSTIELPARKPTQKGYTMLVNFVNSKKLIAKLAGLPALLRVRGLSVYVKTAEGQAFRRAVEGSSTKRALQAAEKLLGRVMLSAPKHLRICETREIQRSFVTFGSSA